MGASEGSQQGDPLDAPGRREAFAHVRALVGRVLSTVHYVEIGGLEWYALGDADDVPTRVELGLEDGSFFHAGWGNRFTYFDVEWGMGLPELAQYERRVDVAQCSRWSGLLGKPVNEAAVLWWYDDNDPVDGDEVDGWCPYAIRLSFGSGGDVYLCSAEWWQGERRPFVGGVDNFMIWWGRESARRDGIESDAAITTIAS